MPSFFKKYFDSRLPYLIKYMPIDLKKVYVYTNESEKRNSFQRIINFLKELIETEKQMIKNKDKDCERYDNVTDEEIVIDDSPTPVYYMMGGGIILLSLIMLLLSLGKVWILNLILVFIGLLFFLYAYTAPKKQLIFDRLSGLFTFPDWFYMKPHTVEFAKHNKFFWSSTGGASGAAGQQLVTAPPKSARSIWLYTHVPGFSGSWSFMLWYMDKNRPLPPGNAFDSYREEDFLRRKAAGFPPPLFKSTFPTPENTPEQNTERRKYWKDEDYYGESESAWY